MKNLHLLVIGTVWPEPHSSAAGSRMMQILSLFQEAGWEITFASSAAKSKYSADLEQMKIHCETIKLNDSSFDEFVKNLMPDVVLFDRFMTEEQFGWRVAEQCPDTLRILDTEDLHSLRSARQKAVKKKRSFHETDVLSEDLAKREIASIYRCDLSLIISKAEVDLLQRVFRVDQSLLYYLPFLLEPVDENQISNYPSFEERSHFMTIGNFLHPPNADSVMFLKKKIWPLIRQQLPKAEMHIYGAYPSQKMLNLHQPKEGFLIKGRAEDATTAISQARVMLAPLRFGAGLKGKLVEAMQCGTPSVTTTIGAEGIAGAEEWNGFIADKAQEIADAAVNLYSDSDSWNRSQQKGAEIINKKFLKADFEGEFIERIQDLRDKLKDHRQRNFTGSMLMHHSMASTRFMSKWIEEKNRLK